MKKSLRQKSRIAKAGPGFFLVILGLASFFGAGRYVAQALFFNDETGQHKTTELEAFNKKETRRYILDRNFKELAVSFDLDSVYVFPSQISDPELTAGRLAEVLDIDAKKIVESCKTKRNLVWLAHGVKPAAADKIRQMHLPGVRVRKEERRYYPNHFSAAHVVGFLKENHGIAGVECFYDSVLRGNGLQTVMPFSQYPGEQYSAKGEDGHLVVTLDVRIQKLLEKKLAEIIADTGARGAQAMVMATDSGAILALVNLPAYDPNRYWDFDEFTRRNRVLSEPVHAEALERIYRMALFDQNNKPGKGKLLKSAGVSSSWRTLKKGLYVSPEIAWEFPGEPAVDEQNIFKNNGLFRNEVEIDFPHSSSIQKQFSQTEENSTDKKTSLHKASTLELAAYFTRLASGGRVNRPHLLSGIWNERSGELVSLPPEIEKKNVDKEIYNKINKLLNKTGRDGDKNLLVVESLADDSILKPVIADGELDGQHKSFKESKEESKHRFQSVLLSMAPGLCPEITMVAVLDNAEIDVSAPSPLRKMTEQIAGKMVNWAREITLAPDPGIVQAKVDGFYNEWLGAQAAIDQRENKKNVVVAEIKPDKPALSPTMPDLKGYSLRKALQEIQKYEMRVNVVGYGWVTDQVPAAGSRLAGQKCILKLSMAREELIRTITIQ